MEYLKDDNISLSFFTKANLRQKNTAYELLKIIQIYGKLFLPNELSVIQNWEHVNINDFKALVEKWSRSDNILMRRLQEYQSIMTVQMSYAASGGYNFITIGVEEKYFLSSIRTKNFIEMGKDIYNLISPMYGFIHQTKDKILMSTVIDQKFGKTVSPVDLRKGLPGIYWSNFFGPEIVLNIGKEKLLSFRSEKKEELLDGGMLLILTPSPLTPSSEYHKEKQKELSKSIGKSFFDIWKP